MLAPLWKKRLLQVFQSQESNTEECHHHLKVNFRKTTSIFRGLLCLYLISTNHPMGK